MTKSLSFDHMKDVLVERFKCQGKVVHELYIDNRCSLRWKLQSVFGAQLKVLLYSKDIDMTTRTNQS